MKLTMEKWRKFVNESHSVYRKKDQSTRGGATFGYVLGTVKGEIIDSKNEEGLFYGASIPKPILALANLITYSGTKKSLTDKELQGLINYTGLDSNAVNRALSGRIRTKDKKTKDKKTGKIKILKKDKKRKVTKSRPALGNFRAEKGAAGQTTDEFVSKLGIAGGGARSAMAIRYGYANNYQSPLQYFNFLSLLLNIDELTESSTEQWEEMSQGERFLSAYPEEVKKVLGFMKRDYFNALKKGRRPDRELGGILDMKKYLLKKHGIMINKIYGKGGKAAGSLNYGVVLNDKYIFVIYTDFGNQRRGHQNTKLGGKHRIKLYDIMANAIGAKLGSMQERKGRH